MLTITFGFRLFPVVLALEAVALFEFQDLETSVVETGADDAVVIVPGQTPYSPGFLQVEPFLEIQSAHY